MVLWINIEEKFLNKSCRFDQSIPDFLTILFGLSFLLIDQIYLELQHYKTVQIVAQNVARKYQIFHIHTFYQHLL